MLNALRVEETTRMVALEDSVDVHHQVDNFSHIVQTGEDFSISGLEEELVELGEVLGERVGYHVLVDSGMLLVEEAVNYLLHGTHDSISELLSILLGDLVIIEDEGGNSGIGQ